MEIDVPLGASPMGQSRREDEMEVSGSMLEGLPLELQEEIFLKLPIRSVQSLSCTSKYFRDSYGRNPNFWHRKALYDDLLTQKEYIENLSVTEGYDSEAKLSHFQNLYICLVFRQRNIAIRGAENFFPINLCTLAASKAGDLRMIDYFIEKGGSPEDVVFGVIEGDHLHILQGLIKDFRPGIWVTVEMFQTAIRSRSVKILDFLLVNTEVPPLLLIPAISEAIDSGQLDLGMKIYNLYPSKRGRDFLLRAAIARKDEALISWALTDEPTVEGYQDAILEAASSGSRDTVQKLIERYPSDDGFDFALIGAAVSGRIDDLRYYLEQEPSDIGIDQALTNAIRNGDRRIIEILLEVDESAEPDFILDDELIDVARTKDREIVIFLLDRFGESIGSSWSLKGAAAGNRVELVNELIARFPQDVDFALMGACQGGHLELVVSLLEHGVTPYAIEVSLEIAASRGLASIVRILYQHGSEAISIFSNDDILIEAVRSGSIETVGAVLSNNTDQVSVGDALIEAGRHANLEIFQLLRGLNKNPVNLTAAYTNALLCGHRRILDTSPPEIFRNLEPVNLRGTLLYISYGPEKIDLTRDRYFNTHEGYLFWEQWKLDPKPTILKNKI